MMLESIEYDIKWVMGICMCCPNQEDESGNDEKDYLFTPDVNSYDGERNRKKLRHGKGVYYYGNGDVYDGYWNEDKKHGEGEYRFNTGKVLIGYFEKDTFVGSLPTQTNDNSKGKKKKKKKKKDEKPAKPLWMDDDGLIRNDPPQKDQHQTSASTGPRKLIDPSSRFDGMTEEEKQNLIQKETLKRETTRRSRERHKETTDRIRKKYNIASKKTSMA